MFIYACRLGSKAIVYVLCSSKEEPSLEPCVPVICMEQKHASFVVPAASLSLPTWAEMLVQRVTHTHSHTHPHSPTDRYSTVRTGLLRTYPR